MRHKLLFCALLTGAIVCSCFAESITSERLVSQSLSVDSTYISVISKGYGSTKEVARISAIIDALNQLAIHKKILPLGVHFPINTFSHQETSDNTMIDEGVENVLGKIIYRRLLDIN